MGFFKRSLAGPGYVILNVIRAMNIVSLLAVIAASTVMLVKTFVISKFFFFDAVSHVITAVLAMFLIISETPLFRSYFARNFPLLSFSSGFVFLGLLMTILGVFMLGNLNKQATSQSSLGLSFWRIVISSGIVVLILGIVNIVASFIFCDASNSVTARLIRTHGAVAPQKALLYRSPTTYPAQNWRKTFLPHRSPDPDPSLPSYHTSPSPTPQPMTQRPLSRSNSSLSNNRPAQLVRSASLVSTRFPLNISAPVDVEQGQFAKFKGSQEVKKPDLMFHPAMVGGGGRTRASSFYSQPSHF